MNLKKYPFYLLIALLFSLQGFTQNKFSSDELFQQARTAAFDKKDYPLAIALSKEALSSSPDYADIRIFLGRIYTWSDKIDSARNCFETVLNKTSDNEDAAAAFADLEYWNNNPTKSLSICENALQFHPQSSQLLLKKAKALIDLKQFTSANTIISQILKTDPKNDAARSLGEKIKFLSFKNKISISYDYISFDKQFDDPWHIVSLDYGRTTKMGSVIGRVNYGNRFKTNALQFEADAYPRISKTFYSYVNAGFSDSSGVFPKFRSGFSLYANLPKSFEAEAGFRYLYFSSATWIYTASVGKYFKNYWFNFRTYLTPGSSSISHSYSLTTRYYYKGNDDFIALSLGTGISPDDRSNNVQLTNLYKLKSNRISIDFRNSINKFNTISVSLGWAHQEYLPKVTGNQYLASLSYLRKF